MVGAGKGERGLGSLGERRVGGQAEFCVKAEEMHPPQACEATVPKAE